MQHFLCGVESVKLFVKVHLYCNVTRRQPEKDNQNVQVAFLSGKISADAHARDWIEKLQSCNWRLSELLALERVTGARASSKYVSATLTVTETATTSERNFTREYED